MKTLKKIQISAILLFVTVIIFASFFGVYKKEDFRVKNIMKKYKLGMQFTDSILFTATPCKDEEHQSEDDKQKTDNGKEFTKENFKLTKKIIKNRLKGMNIGEYKINLDETTGKITIKLQNNDDIHEIEEHIKQKGEFTIIDKETEEVLLNNNDVKSSKVVYGATGADNTTTTIYLQINFNKDGAKKLEEISQTYVKIEDNDEKTSEEQTAEEEVNAKYVSVVLDGQTLSSTYFGEKMSTGVLYIPITQASDNETLTNYVKEVGVLSTIINNGEFPCDYDFEEETMQPSLKQNDIFLIIAIPSALLLVAYVVVVCKFKTKGFISTFMQIGYIALLLLAIRYTNVITTVETIVGVVVFTIMNYVFNYMVLNNYKKDNKFNWKTAGKFALYTSPIYVLAIVLAFNALTEINSLGMAMVWGAFCLYIFNLSLTKAVLDVLNNK